MIDGGRPLSLSWEITKDGGIPKEKAPIRQARDECGKYDRYKGCLMLVRRQKQSAKSIGQREFCKTQRLLQYLI